MRPKSVVLQSQKKLEVLEKKIKKRVLPVYLCGYDLQNCVWIFFK